MFPLPLSINAYIRVINLISIFLLIGFKKNRDKFLLNTRLLIARIERDRMLRL